ncbi:LLM class flavin-dependent oxidoreductase [Cupriavidus sp. PET2-C1]
MSLEFTWHVPSHGSAALHYRDAAYLINVARAAEYAGFHGIQLATGPGGLEPSLAAALLARHTARLRFLVACRPGSVQPAVAAQSTQTLQSISGNRLLLNVVTGGSQAERRAYGDLLEHEDRHQRTHEFLQVLRHTWKGRAVFAGQLHFHGSYFRVENAGLLKPLRNPPPIYLGGGSAQAEQLAAELGDVHLRWNESPAQAGERIRRLRELAAGFGRSLRFAYGVHVIARETERQAADDAARARRAPGTALVGSYKQVAQRLEALHALGLDSFVLSAEPELQELLRLGEEVLPLLRKRPLATPQAPLAV